MHSRLKKQGGEAFLPNGGLLGQAEEPPAKENGKRPAPAVEKEKGKKRKVEIVKFNKIEAGSLEAGDEEGRVAGVAKPEKEKRRTRGAEKVELSQNEEPVPVAEVTPTGETAEMKGKKAKKGRKKDGKAPVSEEENGSRKVNKQEKEFVETGPGEMLAGKTTKKGKQKTDGAAEKPDVLEASETDGALPGKRKARKTKDRQALQEGGAREVEAEPPAVAPQEGKKSRAALKRAAAKGGDIVQSAEIVDLMHAGNGDADVPSEKKKRRKAGQVMSDADVAADVSAAAEPTESKKRRKVAKGAAAEADVADDVGGGSVGREAQAGGARKKKGGKAKGEAGGPKADAIAAIESALEELRRAPGGAAEDAPAVASEHDAPAVDNETGRKKRRKKNIAQNGVESEVPGTPVGEVDFQSSGAANGEGESAVKRRKSGAGSTPAVAPKVGERLFLQVVECRRICSGVSGHNDQRRTFPDGLWDVRFYKAPTDWPMFVGTSRCLLQAPS